TATHTDIWQKVQNGTFRADLFYRLQGIHVHLPALRNRQDRLPFAKMILKQVEKELHKQTLSFSTNADITWPRIFLNKLFSICCINKRFLFQQMLNNLLRNIRGQVMSVSL